MREILFWKNEKGYHLQVGEESVRLSHAESREILGHMLAELPSIPGGVKAAWELSRQPHIRVYNLYEAHDGQVVQHAQRAEIEVGKVVQFKLSSSNPNQLQLDCFEWLGSDDAVVHDPVDDLSSKLAAEKAADKQKLDIYLRENNMTMKELAAAIQKGEI